MGTVRPLAESFQISALSPKSLWQIKMRKEKKKEETGRDEMERLNRGEYNDIDWVELYNSDKLSSLRVNELSLYFTHQKITSKGKES